MQFSSIKKTTTKIQNALHLSINIFDTEVVFIEDIVFTDGTAVANVYVCLTKLHEGLWQSITFFLGCFKMRGIGPVQEIKHGTSYPPPPHPPQLKLT